MENRVPARVIAVWGASGSPGTSTIAASIAATLGRRGRVILVDLDVARGTLAAALMRGGTGITLGGALLTLPPDGAPLPDGFLHELSWGVRFLPGVVGAAAPVTLRLDRVGALLDRLTLECDVLVLDLGEELPPRPGGDIHMEALRRASLVLIVAIDTPQGELDLQGEFPLLHAAFTSMGRTPALCGAVNGIENAHFSSWRRLFREYGIPFTGHVPHDRLAALRAWERRQPITVADPSSVAAKSLTALSGELAQACNLPSSRE